VRSAQALSVYGDIQRTKPNAEQWDSRQFNFTHEKIKPRQETAAS